MLLRFNLSRTGQALLLLALAGLAAPSFAAGWHKFAPKNGGFSAEFPGKPNLVTKGGIGEGSDIWIYGDKQRKFLLLASTSDYFNGHPAAREELQRDEAGFLQEVKGKTLTSKRGHTRGANGKMLPSSAFTFETEAGMRGAAKVILDGDTVYMVVMMWDKNSPLPDVRKRFFASYKLRPRTRPPVPKGTFGWRTVAPKNAGFSAEFPCKPGFETQVQKHVVDYIWACRGKSQKVMVMLGTSDFYGADVVADDTFHQLESGFLEAVKGKELSNKRETFQDANGRQLPASVFTFTMFNGWHGVFRMVLDGNTMYVMDVAWKKGFDASDVRKRVMASYKLLPRTMPPQPPAQDAADGDAK